MASTRFSYAVKTMRIYRRTKRLCIRAVMRQHTRFSNMTNFRLLLVLSFVLTACGGLQSAPDDPIPKSSQGYTLEETTESAKKVFGGVSSGLGQALARAFKDYGKPSAVISGSEGAGALIVGLRYGEGEIEFFGGKTHKIFWQSPSVGFDAGGNASKVFILVYGAKTPQDLHTRFPSVDGSVYVVGGVGINYARTKRIVVAPIRAGVGLRGGINVGYLKFSPEKSVNPF